MRVHLPKSPLLPPKFSSCRRPLLQPRAAAEKSAGPATLPELVLHNMAHDVNIRLSLCVSLSLPLVLDLALCVAYDAVIDHTFVVYKHTSRMALAEGQRETLTLTAAFVASRENSREATTTASMTP